MSKGKLEEARMAAEKAAIESALETCGGVISHAAKMLGISRMTLYRKASQFGIPIARGDTNTAPAVFSLPTQEEVAKFAEEQGIPLDAAEHQLRMRAIKGCLQSARSYTQAKAALLNLFGMVDVEEEEEEAA
jgi:hypothetical protein